jgi:hypothetical protein
VPGSVNVNEGSYDAFAPKSGPGEGKDDARDVLTDQDNFASDREEYEEQKEGQEPDRPAFLSADPHRTLRPLADLIMPKPASESEATPDRGFRRGGAQTRTAANTDTDLGPCLYFGPAGERCDRRAVEDGFCARHQQSRAGWTAASSSLSIPQVTKRAVGAAGLIAVLWPILADLIREIIRLLR